MSGPLDSFKVPTAVVVGGTYNVVSPAPVDGQSLSLQQDANGNLLVNVAAGGGGGSSTVKIEDTTGQALNSNGSGALQVAVVSGGGSNASVGTTGASAPTSATEIGIINGSGNLTGVSPSTPLPISATAVANASGNPIFTESVAGSTTTVTQGTGTNLHAVIDSGTVTASLAVGTAVELLDSGGTNKASISAGGALSVAATQITSPWVVDGAGAANAALVGNPVLIAGSDYGGTAAAQIPKIDSTGLLWINHQKINNATISTSASGTQKVGIVGGAAGVTLDAVLGATKPANVLQVGGNDGTNSYGIPLASGGVSVVISGTVAQGAAAAGGATAWVVGGQDSVNNPRALSVVPIGTSAGNPLMIGGADGVGNSQILQFSAKGSQPATAAYIAVQEPQNAGRNYVILYATLIAGVTSEALATFTKNVAGTATTGQTAYTITNGKTFRIQALSVQIANTTTVANNIIVNVRAAASVSASSPIVLSCATAAAAAVATVKGFANLSVPDGMELLGNGTLQIGISHLENVTTASIASFVLTGYEY